MVVGAWCSPQKLTLEELGLRARLSRRQLGEIERGKGNPRLRTILLLIEALGLSVDEFVALWREAQREVEGGPR